MVALNVAIQMDPIEKIEITAGWTAPQPDEEWTTGYPPEIEDFVDSVAFGDLRDDHVAPEHANVDAKRGLSGRRRVIGRRHGRQEDEVRALQSGEHVDDGAPRVVGR